ncbi:hypothetical protein CONPUDRAFT_160307 [Coniophora puteana RWD-64-598 SS2]|uniref:KOW domain-containing protein n=1 Tax=Coniophora puteana (strain RWD-64-598) TaxID=741705 RepID=R7SGU4_CONPW|nr:uncharacterized protein CONPUDRAFT_160307 [Coniophora puteana RWD-64-598 SS2]EIW74264.1 hypothetical protein CONPUDRAFT_160307 [Coniophora puteana RWD-64-598 SS2]
MKRSSQAAHASRRSKRAFRAAAAFVDLAAEEDPEDYEEIDDDDDDENMEVERLTPPATTTIPGPSTCVRWESVVAGIETRTTRQVPALSDPQAWDIVKEFADGESLPIVEDRLQQYLGPRYVYQEWSPIFDGFSSEDDAEAQTRYHTLRNTYLSESPAGGGSREGDHEGGGEDEGEGELEDEGEVEVKVEGPSGSGDNSKGKSKSRSTWRSLFKVWVSSPSRNFLYAYLKGHSIRVDAYDGLANYLYVEASSQAEAYNLFPLPHRNHVRVLEYIEDFASPSLNSQQTLHTWVRPKSGRYVGDVGFVIDETSENGVTALFVPKVQLSPTSTPSHPRIISPRDSSPSLFPLASVPGLFGSTSGVKMSPAGRFIVGQHIFTSEGLVELRFLRNDVTPASDVIPNELGQFADCTLNSTPPKWVKPLSGPFKDDTALAFDLVDRLPAKVLLVPRLQEIRQGEKHVLKVSADCQRHLYPVEKAKSFMGPKNVKVYPDRTYSVDDFQLTVQGHIIVSFDPKTLTPVPEPTEERAVFAKYLPGEYVTPLRRAIHSKYHDFAVEHFARGDRVQVKLNPTSTPVYGQVLGVSIDRTVQVLLGDATATQPVSVSSSQVSREWWPGDSVCVCAGSHRGSRGTVLRQSGETLEVSELTTHAQFAVPVSFAESDQQPAAPSGAARFAAGDYVTSLELGRWSRVVGVHGGRLCFSEMRTEESSSHGMGRLQAVNRGVHLYDVVSNLGMLAQAGSDPMHVAAKGRSFEQQAKGKAMRAPFYTGPDPHINEPVYVRKGSVKGYSGYVKDTNTHRRTARCVLTAGQKVVELKFEDIVSLRTGLDLTGKPLPNNRLDEFHQLRRSYFGLMHPEDLPPRASTPQYDQPLDDNVFGGADPEGMSSREEQPQQSEPGPLHWLLDNNICRALGSRRIHLKVKATYLSGRMVKMSAWTNGPNRFYSNAQVQEAPPGHVAITYNDTHGTHSDITSVEHFYPFPPSKGKEGLVVSGPHAGYISLVKKNKKSPAQIWLQGLDAAFTYDEVSEVAQIGT